MRKFLAVIKREYKKVVFTWAFVITTFLMPLIASLFVLVPMLIFSIEGRNNPDRRRRQKRFARNSYPEESFSGNDRGKSAKCDEGFVSGHFSIAE